MVRLKIGVQLHQQHCSIAQYRQAWRRADELGVDSIWNWDHFFPLYGDPNGRHWEGWTTLAVLGCETRRARIGCLVLCMSYRNAALLSQMARTLDHLCGGRLILGVGAGWFARDYQEYGYDFGTPGARLKNLERAIGTLKERWAKDEPKPVRGTIPLLIGGGGEKVTLRLAAEHADFWNTTNPPEAWAHKNRVLDEWCRKVGRDPTTIERTAATWSPDLAQAEQYAAAGAEHIIYGFGPPFDFGPVERLLEWRENRPE
jgi:probable F420-dependent oxidoreductase